MSGASSCRSGVDADESGSTSGVAACSAITISLSSSRTAAASTSRAAARRRAERRDRVEVAQHRIRGSVATRSSSGAVTSGSADEAGTESVDMGQGSCQKRTRTAASIRVPRPTIRYSELLSENARVTATSTLTRLFTSATTCAIASRLSCGE